FSAENIVDLVYAHMAKPPVPPSQQQPGLPAILDEIVLKLLNKNAEERYQGTKGLLLDLEECRRQLAKTGTIETFAVAQQDVTDKLSFPQKLYGREQEVQLLLDTFEMVSQGSFAMLLVGGYSGIGKTALVHEVHKSILARNGYFISGKYDQLKKNIPYSALIDAIRQLIQQILSEPEHLTRAFAQKVLEELDGHGALMIEVVPELELLIGKQPEVAELPVAEAQNRFRDFLRRFISSFASADHPLTIFIDDLQWADLSTIQFISRLAQDEHNHYIYFIGAYRDNEVSALHPLMLAIEEIREQGFPLHLLAIKPLSDESVNQLLADTLKCAKGTTVELAEVVSKQTGANPFFIRMFIRRLVEDGLIWLDQRSFSWKWNTQKILQAGITENVVELMMQQLKRLPRESQDLLKIAACLGNRFDLATLKEVTGLQTSKIALRLWEPLSHRFIIPLDDAYKTAETLDSDDAYINVRYQFAHDRVQQATYNMLSQGERLQMHHLIAQKLLQALSDNEVEERIFEVVNHYNTALSLVDQPREKSMICALNLRAAVKAKEAASFPVALNFFRIATELFEPDAWENDHERTARAYLDLAECEYICGEYDASDQLYSLILEKSDVPEFIARVYDIRLRQYAQQGRNKETLRLGATVLRKYGVSFIAEPSLLQVFPQLIAAKAMLQGKDVEAFVDLPAVTVREKAFAIQTLMNISATAYVYNSNTMLLLVIRMLQLSVKYGNTAESAFGYGLFGFVEGAALGNVEQCRKFAELSLKVSEKFDDPIIRAKVKFLKAFSTQHWFEPIPEAIPLLKDAFKTLDYSGSYTFATYTLHTIIGKQLYLGQSLTSNYEELVEYSLYTDRVKEFFSQNLLLILRRYVSGLTGIYYEHYKEADAVLEEASYLQMLREKRLLMAVAWHYVYNQMLYYQLGDLEKATAYAREAVIVDDVAPTTMAQIEHHFYNVLLEVERYPGLSFSARIASRRRAQKHIGKLKKWMKGCPVNFSTRYHLAATAWAAVTTGTAQDDAFQKTLELAREDNNLQLQGLTLEHWAKSLFRTGRVGDAAEKIVAATDSYGHWGAATKVKQLTREFRPYLETSAAQTKETSQGSLGDLLDMETVLRASRAISGEIVLENLLSNLLGILMENVGAQRGFLILNRGDQLMIEAEYTTGAGKQAPQVLQSEPVAESSKLSGAIVHYVWRTGENVLLDDAQQASAFSSDTYLNLHQVRSLLCVPVKNQGKINAIVYFENNLAANAFTEQRLNMATLLASQAAISIDNAMLYNNLERMVEERTRELASEKKKTDELLLNILPAEIAEELKEKGQASAKLYEEATILFCDFRNFTQLAENTQPTQLVKLIDMYFSAFDELMQQHGIEKIKTVGDAYIAAGGLPDPEKGRPAEVVQVAIEMQAMAERLRQEREAMGEPSFELRIGIHTGPVIAGVVGLRKFAYDIWGDTVNTAARLEQHGVPGKINISGATFAHICDDFACTYRGKIKAKHKGEIDMYFVDGPVSKTKKGRSGTK
ncbi:MAG: GAF domain-containing protein, partial [Bacteroidetes bacterium]